MSEIPFREPRADLPEDVAAVIGQVDIAFVIDTTGSMAPFINEARNHVREAAEKVAQIGGLDLRYAVVEYRDHTDPWVTRVHDFADAERLTQVLNMLEAGGGGDRPEAVWDGVYALYGLQWRPQAERLAFLVGDSPPHVTDCPCSLTAARVIESLTLMRVRLDAHSIAGQQDTAASFRSLAESTNGAFTEVARDRIEESTRAYGGRLTSTSGVVADSRDLIATASMSPVGTSAADVGRSLGWTESRTRETMSTLRRRNLASSAGASAADDISTPVDVTVTSSATATPANNASANPDISTGSSSGAE